MSELEEQDPIENNEHIRQLQSNWKLVGITSAFVNRGFLGNSVLRQNISFHNQKPLLMKELGEPVILDVSYLDVYNINFHRYIHNGIPMDLRFLNQAQQPQQPLSPQTSSNIVDHIMNGLVVINEHISDFIAYSYDTLYNPKIKKVIDFLIQQREQCLSILRNKT